jgi:mRNA-degrading endonuclease RelE of RelBE toxin-antitoxin system
MPTDPASPLQITFTPEFKRNLRQPSKKYHHIKTDLQPIINELTNAKKPGDQVPQVRYEAFKVWAKHSDARKGKSGGYRLIYFVKSQSEVVLVTVYSKTKQADITAEQIRQIILDMETATAPDQAPKQQDSGKA